MRRCAENPLMAELSLCGDAFDAFASGDADEPYEIAGPGQSVNCEDCCRAMRAVKKMRNPMRPRSDWLKGRHVELAQSKRGGE